MMPRPLLLACEDEDRIVDLLRALTEPLGIDLIAARDGASAMAHLLTRRPALLTLDLVLPNLDGFAVLERIRQRRELEGMPIVIISALSDSATIKRAYELGVADYVTKPFNVDLLNAKLRVFFRLQHLADEVRERQLFLESVVDHLSSGLLVVDGDGVLVKVNAAAATMLSRPVASLRGRKVTEALPGAEALFCVTGDAAQRRVSVVTPHGERTLGFTNSVIEVEGRRGALAVFRELSDVEAAEREQEERRRREELAASARSFAHEVRNPLSAIAAAAQVIARPDCTEAQRIRLARALESEATRVTGLVQEYVERRQTTAQEQAVDLPLLLQEVVEINLLPSPARARISLNTEQPLPAVRADAARLKQVVLNLVLNAVKATDQGGSITLSARRDSGGVVLCVRDSGCGIATADLPRIFDETFSTRQGGGLGLTIARRIVEQHGGTIAVESTKGRGSSFTVWLPAA